MIDSLEEFLHRWKESRENKEDLQEGGLRSLTLQRCENGFGFTLRHFIVYPPDTEDEQDPLVSYGIGKPKPVLEPMDTIFVRHVRENGPGHRAGLARGDRIVSVNGDTITGKTYAQVVHLIQNSANYLHLLVVPQEEDILQLYFSEAAHNPETNARPYLPPPVMANRRPNNQFSHLPRPKPYQPVLVSCGNVIASASPPITVPSSAHTWKPPIYQNVPEESKGTSHRSRGLPKQNSLPSSNSLDATMVPTCLTKFSSLESLKNSQQHNQLQQMLADYRLSVECGHRDSTSSLPNSFLSSTTQAKSLPGLPHDSETHVSDSVLSRIRKSFEQKEEFLKRPSNPIWFPMSPPPPVPREFYAQPQKFQKPLWPPPQAIEENKAKVENKNLQRVKSELDRERGSSYANNSKGYSQRMNKAFVTTLSRIQENIPSGENSPTVNNSPFMYDSSVTCSLPSSPAHSTIDGSFSRSYSSPVRYYGYEDSFYQLQEKPTESERILALQLVSRRAKQFESGELDHDAVYKTNLCKSEISRLSAKKHIPNVATRKQEFEMKSQEGQSPDGTGAPFFQPLSGNRLTVVGGGKLHCDPPQHFHEWLDSGPEIYHTNDSLGSLSDDDTSNRKSAVRQDSYLAAVREPTSERDLLNENIIRRFNDGGGASKKGRWSCKPETGRSVVVPNRPARPTVLSIPNPIRPATTDECSPTFSLTPNTLTPGSLSDVDLSGLEDGLTKLLAAFGSASRVPVSSSATACTSVTITTSTNSISPSDNPQTNLVVRRTKHIQLEDEADRVVRRVSYLRATCGDRMNAESDTEVGDIESSRNSNPCESHLEGVSPIHSIHKLRSLFVEKSSIGGISEKEKNNSQSSDAIENDPITREGCLHCKITLQDGKRATDRSWKQYYAVLRQHTLTLYKDKKDSSQSPQTLEEQTINLKSCVVDIAGDYTKKKHVFRLTTGGSEYLFQGEDADDMLIWIKTLQETNVEKENESKKQESLLKGQTSHLSPVPGHKGIKKLTNFRNRSPTGHSPVTKTRKHSQTGEQISSPKSKTWKGKVAKQFRRIQGNTPTSPVHNLEGITIGAQLEDCLPCAINEFIPQIVDICTSIVESKGLDIIGIYRVPGNTAAVTALTESVNRGFETVDLQDPRWSDVNVISSLLKSFFRKLPDPLLTCDLYPLFIEADKVEDRTQRMLTLKKLVHELPDHHFETLRHLLKHLQRVVNHSGCNKMEARNLAIVFGPTLVRTADDHNMVAMVTDMSNQCRIVETLITHVDWFFQEEDSTESTEQNVPFDIPVEVIEGPGETTSVGNPNLLLNNIQKVEGMKYDSPNKEISAKDIVSSIISAANRKMQKTRHKKGSDDSKPSKVRDEEKKTTAEKRPSLEFHDLSTHSIIEPQLQGSGKISHVLSLVRPNGSAGGSSRHGSDGEPLSSLWVTSSPLSLHHNPEVFTFNGTRNGTRLGTSSLPSERLSDDVAIRSYTGLSANTQERIRQFELETKAMLYRDMYRQKKELEHRQQERHRIELEWQKAKREMEAEDFFDHLADNPSDILRRPLSYTTGYSSVMHSGTPYITLNPKGEKDDNSNEYENVFHEKGFSIKTNSHHCHHPRPHGQKALSYSYPSPLFPSPSIYYPRPSSAPSQHEVKSLPSYPPTNLIRRGTSIEDLTKEVADDAQNVPSHGSLKRVTKTAKTKDDSRSSVSPNVPNFSYFRCNSLDSLRETHLQEPKETEISSTSSETGSDLLSSITATFDQKLKFFLDPNYCLEEDHHSESNKKGGLRKSTRESGKTQVLCQKLDDNRLITKAKGENSVSDSAKGNCITSSKLKRSDSLTKTEKTENNNKTKENKESIHKHRRTNKYKVMKKEGLKRRHTVGGTEDFEKFYRWGGRKNNKVISAWERLQPVVTDNELNSARNLQSWLRKERLRTSSPDLRRGSFVVDIDIGDELPERTHSLHEPTALLSVYAVPLESQV